MNFPIRSFTPCPGRLRGQVAPLPAHGVGYLSHKQVNVCLDLGQTLCKGQMVSIPGFAATRSLPNCSAAASAAPDRRRDWTWLRPQAFIHTRAAASSFLRTAACRAALMLPVWDTLSACTTASVLTEGRRHQRPEGHGSLSEPGPRCTGMAWRNPRHPRGQTRTPCLQRDPASEPSSFMWSLTQKRAFQERRYWKHGGSSRGEAGGSQQSCFCVAGYKAWV